MVFFSGMPSEAAGPVAETVTPTLMSARAKPLVASKQAVARVERVSRFVIVVSLLWVIESVDEAHRPPPHVCGDRPGSLDALQRKGNSLPHANAHGGQGAAPARALQLTQRRECQARTRSTQGVAQGKCAAVGVDMCGVIG